MALTLDNNSIMGGSFLAAAYRRKVCGYCARGLPLHQIMMEHPWEEPEVWHIDVDGSYYPCAVVVEMLETHDREIMEIHEVAKQKAERDRKALESYYQSLQNVLMP